MRELILIDLRQQAPFLPPELRRWPRERLLAWLRVWGEVWEAPEEGIYIDRRPEPPRNRTHYAFRSWVGLSCAFYLTDDGKLWVSGAGFIWPDFAA